MSTKAKVLIALAFVTVVYFLVSGDSEPVEVDIDE